MPYKINQFLLRVAMEVGAQEAAKKEIARQVLENDPPGSTVEFTSMAVDMTLTYGDILIDGESAEIV